MEAALWLCWISIINSMSYTTFLKIDKELTVINFNSTLHNETDNTVLKMMKPKYAGSVVN